MGLLVALLLAMTAVAAGVPAGAQAVRARVAEGSVLRCGATSRPGFAEADGVGAVSGLAVDLCRALAIAVAGPRARVQFAVYETGAEAAALARGDADIAFLSGPEIAAAQIVDKVVPGPSVFIEPVSVLVPLASSVRRIEDLRGKTVCFISGGEGQGALEAAVAARRVEIARLAFQEDAEMLDGYDVGHCQAMADSATRLLRFAGKGGVNHLRSRLLPEPLAFLPIVAVTDAADGKWSALTAWVLAALILSDAPASAWRAASPAALAALGLHPGWREEIAASLGTYGTMLRRNFGDSATASAPLAVNAPWPDGLLLPPALP